MKANEPGVPARVHVLRSRGRREVRMHGGGVTGLHISGTYDMALRVFRSYCPAGRYIPYGGIVNPEQTISAALDEAGDYWLALGKEGAGG